MLGTPFLQGQDHQGALQMREAPVATAHRRARARGRRPSLQGRRAASRGHNGKNSDWEPPGRAHGVQVGRPVPQTVLPPAPPGLRGRPASRPSARRPVPAFCAPGSMSVPSGLPSPACAFAAHPTAGRSRLKSSKINDICRVPGVRPGCGFLGPPSPSHPPSGRHVPGPPAAASVKAGVVSAFPAVPSA